MSKYCLAVGFDVDGGSSSSHGQTDTETAVVASSHGHTALEIAPAIADSIFSDIDFDPSLFIFDFEFGERGSGRGEVLLQMKKRVWIKITAILWNLVVCDHTDISGKNCTNLFKFI